MNPVQPGKASIRKATKADCALIFSWIKKLAKEEHRENKVMSSMEMFEKDGFGECPSFHSIILEYNNRPVGFGLYYFGYGSWIGKTIVVDDVYIEPEFRSSGLGALAFAYIAQEALKNECMRLEGFVYHEEMPMTAAFYLKYGAHVEKGLWRCQLNGHGEIKKVTGLLEKKANS